MRVLVDTNVLISGAVLKSEAVATVLRSILGSAEHALLIADYSIDEACRVVHAKWPERRRALDAFLVDAGYEAVPDPGDALPDQGLAIRDPNDLPVLRAAIAGRADAIVTGDKDFAGASTGGVPVYTPAQFIVEFL